MQHHPIIKARDFATRVHNEANHTYYGKPYMSHLNVVAFAANKFIHSANPRHINVIVAAAWTHEVLTLPTVSFSELRLETNLLSAYICFAMLPNKGKYRDTQFNDDWYKTVKETPYADYLVLCDRLADASQAVARKSDMLNVFRSEHEKLKDWLYKDKYEQIFKVFDDIYKV